VQLVLQQVCSTCIIEGGYAPEGLRQSIGTASLGGVNLTTAGTFYNLATIRIKSGRPYAVIIPIDIAAQLFLTLIFK
jgi:hypothetical protein